MSAETSAETKPRFSEGQWLYAVVDYPRYDPGWMDESDNWNNSKNYTIVVKVQKTLVLKVTARGAWLDYGEDRRWVSFGTRKVSETPEDALQQAIKRRSYHFQKEQARLEQVQRRLDALKAFGLPEHT